jgi:hypothetical protein
MEHTTIINTLEQSIEDEINQIPVFQTALPPDNIDSLVVYYSHTMHPLKK